VFIVCKKTTANATSADFNSGKAANGTGAYKFIKWSPGDRLDLVRNEDYWGTKPEFEKVMMKFISNDAARTAALLSDSVDLIDLVPPADIPKLKSYANLRVYSTATVRLIYVGLNQRPEGPFITDLDGKPLGKNPLTDPRVRKALSLMIDRNGLVNRILYGSGEPAAQLVPPDVFGYNTAMKPPAADIKEARRLLTEAGYPKGFGITLHSSNDRFLLDREVAQALGQLFARGGIKVNKVETLPYSVYAKEARRGTYGLFVFSYGNVTGESSRGLSSLLHTFDKAKNVGTLNRSLYSNPKFDALLEKAMQEFDAGKREKMLQEATELVFNDTAMIPLYWQSLTWASYKGITYKARRDERTLAMSAAVAK
jgi:peptide/nickel transport system substrate-binding protein